MPDWEFLIQQKGDRQWHSLPQATLAGGTYRMVARSPYPLASVEIEVAFRESDSEPKTILRQSRTSNDAGLIMIFPYRYLPTGDWTVVIAHTEPEVTDKIAIAFQLSPQAIADTCDVADFSLELASGDTTVEANDNPVLAIVLEQSELQDADPNNIPVAGRVALRDVGADLDFPARLRYRLTHPDSGEVLVDEAKSWLPNLQAALPFAFKETLSLALPIDTETLQGEVAIETGDRTLALATFALSLDLTKEEDWAPENAINYTIQLSNIEDRSSFTFDVLVPREIAETPLDVDLPNPALMKGVLRRSLAVERSIMPPKIDPAIAKSQAKKSLQLPKLSTSAE